MVRLLTVFVVLGLIGCGYGEDSSKGQKEGQDEPVALQPQDVPNPPPAAENGDSEPVAEEPEAISPADLDRYQYEKTVLSTVKKGESWQSMLPEARDLILKSNCVHYESTDETVCVASAWLVDAWYYYYSFRLYGGVVDTIYVGHVEAGGE